MSGQPLQVGTSPFAPFEVRFRERGEGLQGFMPFLIPYGGASYGIGTTDDEMSERLMLP